MVLLSWWAPSHQLEEDEILGVCPWPSISIPSVASILVREPFEKLVKVVDFHPRKSHVGTDTFDFNCGREITGYLKLTGGEFPGTVSSDWLGSKGSLCSVG